MAGGFIMATAMAHANKANGAIVTANPGVFSSIAARVEQPLVVYARAGFFSKFYRYLTSYKGLFFHTQSGDAVEFPADVELIHAESTAVPTVL